MKKTTFRYVLKNATFTFLKKISAIFFFVERDKQLVWGLGFMMDAALEIFNLELRKVLSRRPGPIT